MNNVNLIGRITRDLELRYTTQNKPVLEFSIAVNRVTSEGTDFINCTVWNKQAENLAKYQSKGSRIAVNGALRVDKYQDKNGETKYKNYVLVNNIEFLENKKEADLETKKEETPDPFEEFGKEIISGGDLPF